MPFVELRPRATLHQANMGAYVYPDTAVFRFGTPHHFGGGYCEIWMGIALSAVQLLGIFVLNVGRRLRTVYLGKLPHEIMWCLVTFRIFLCK